MPHLDTATLVTTGFSVCFILAALTLMAALYGHRNRTLLYAALGWLFQGAVGLVFFSGLSPFGHTVTIWVSNVVMLLAYGLIWAGLRTFAGKRVSWPWVAAGSIVWMALCLSPTFMLSLNGRVAAFSVIMLCYMGASLRDIWPCWRNDVLGILPVVFFLTMHALFYAQRIVPIAATGDMWPSRGDAALTVFEYLVFVLGIAVSMLLIVRARTERYYQHASTHDDLTGLCNRRALFERGAVLHAEAIATDRPLAALMCDLDWFKAINDRYGHSTGDQVLTVCAERLLALSPRGGVAARLGGEEFLVLVPDTTLEDAHELAERIRHGLGARHAALPVTCSVSVGVSVTSRHDASLDRLISRADQALYAAKTEGRNCTRLWNDELVGLRTPTRRLRVQPPLP